MWLTFTSRYVIFLIRKFFLELKRRIELKFTEEKKYLLKGPLLYYLSAILQGTHIPFPPFSRIDFRSCSSWPALLATSTQYAPFLASTWKLSTDQYNPVQSSAIQYNSVQSSSIQYNLVHSSTFQYNPVQSCTIQYNPVLFSTFQYNPVLSSSIQYNLVQSSTIPYNPG